MVNIMISQDEEVEDIEESSSISKYAISSYGADYTVDGLVKRIKEGDIYVPTFQRGYVWDKIKASRLIESLLLGLPVPGVFFSKEIETNKLLVIDGQQRLCTLQYFYNGVFKLDKEVFNLHGIQKEFDGLTYESLEEEDRRRLDDSIIHATIVRQEQPSNDDSSIYCIFERLNTGGVSLVPQEIRASIYHGEFNDLLHELNTNEQWQTINAGINKRNMKDQELILRFFAFYYNYEKYEKPMKEFLNKYMSKNRHLKLQSKMQIESTFTKSIDIIYQCLGKEAFKPKKTLNSAVFDAVMVGIAKRLEKGEIRDLKVLKEKYKSLLSEENFIAATSRGGTASKDKVIGRITLAIKAFKDIE
ncbi:MAG: DUF262 domain-containing protein [Candidatus Desantisbacteria bacterium]